MTHSTCLNGAGDMLSDRPIRVALVFAWAANGDSNYAWGWELAGNRILQRLFTQFELVVTPKYDGTLKIYKIYPNTSVEYHVANVQFNGTIVILAGTRVDTAYICSSYSELVKSYLFSEPERPQRDDLAGGTGKAKPLAKTHRSRSSYLEQSTPGHFSFADIDNEWYNW